MQMKNMMAKLAAAVLLAAPAYGEKDAKMEALHPSVAAVRTQWQELVNENRVKAGPDRDFVNSRVFSLKPFPVPAGALHVRGEKILSWTKDCGCPLIYGDPSAMKNDATYWQVHFNGGMTGDVLAATDDAYKLLAIWIIPEG